MKLGWFDDGECLTALGAEYNYAVIHEVCRRMWKCEQSWWREDLDTTIILKATWMPTCEEAQALCQAWENAYEKINKMDRSRMGRMRAAAMATRQRRKWLRERASGHDVR